MEELDSSNFDADTNGFSLIDVSASDDDFLFPNHSSEANTVDNQGDMFGEGGHLDKPSDLMAVQRPMKPEANTVDNQGDMFGEGGHVDKPSDLMAVQRPMKPGKLNLRKSLAWDSAFFTSAGVLDAEELSNIMEVSETGPNQNHPLPGIQEELSKSTDSITTFESDSLTLESLEADLFCDIRASIQRSSKSSNLEKNNGDKAGSGCSRKIGRPSDNSVKPKLPSRKPIPAVQGPTTSRMLKPTSIVKPVTKPVVRSKESSLTLPRSSVATGKPSLEGTAASKRSSISAGRVKTEIPHAGNVKGDVKEALIPKGPRHVDSRNSVQKAPATSTLSSASSVSSRTGIRSSHSSYDSSSNSSNTSTIKPYSRSNLGSSSRSSSSENTVKSLLDVRRKVDKNANLPPDSKIRTTSRLPLKSKSQPGECKLSAFVKSTQMLSPTISPASSISEWSTESSSSNATLNQKHSNDRSLDNHDYHAVNMSSHSAKQPTIEAASLARSGSAKPSGLRLPSPKIGFFDGAKAGTKTPSGSARSRSTLPSNLLRSEAGNQSPSGPANKAKPSSGRLGTAKFDPQKSPASPKFTKQPQDHSINLPSGNLLRSGAGNQSPSGPANKAKPGSGRLGTAKFDPQKTPASPKFTKHPQDHSINLPSGNDVGTLSEVSLRTVAKSTLGRNNFVDGENNSTGSQKGLTDDIVNGGSDASIEPPKSSSTSSAIERKSGVSKEADVGKHCTEASSIAFKDDFIVPNKETGEGRKLQSTLDHPIDAVNDGPDALCTTLLPVMEVSQERSSSFVSKNIVSDIFEVKSGARTPNSSARSRSAVFSSPYVPANKSELGRVAGKLSTSTAGRPGITKQKGPASPKLTEQQPQGCSVDLPSDNDSDTFSDVLEPNLATSTLEKNCFVAEASDGEKVADSSSSSDLNNHITNLQKDVPDNIMNDDSDTSIELPISTSISSAGGKQLPKELHNNNISEEADEGKHSTEDLFAKIDNDSSEIFVELPKFTSINSGLECNNKVSEEVGGRKHSSEVNLIAKDYLEFVLKASGAANFGVESETNSELMDCLSLNGERDGEVADRSGATELEDDFGLTIKNDFSISNKEVDVANEGQSDKEGSDSSVELPISAQVNPALDSNTEVSEEADGGIHSSEVSLIAKDYLEFVLKASGAANFGDESETNSELMHCFSLNGERDGEVAERSGGTELEDDFGLTIKDDFIISNKEVDVANEGQSDKEGSDSSVELPICAQVNPALDSNTEVSEEADGGIHSSEVSLIAKDYLEFVLKASGAANFGDESETNSELMHCFSLNGERDGEVAERSGGTELEDDFGLTIKDDFIISNKEVDVANEGQSDKEGSDSSVELPISSLENSVLDNNTEVSEEADGGIHSSEVSFIANDYLEFVLKASGAANFGDESVTNSELLHCFSLNDERDGEVAERSGGTELEDDFGLTIKDDFIISNKKVDVANEGQSVKEGSDTSVELPISALVNSALDSNTEVTEEANGGIHSAEVNFLAKDYLEFVLKASGALKFGVEPGSISELLRCFSPNGGRDREVADVTGGRENKDDCGLTIKNDFIVLNKEADVAIDDHTLLMTDKEVSQGTRSPLAVKNIVSGEVDECKSNILSDIVEGSNSFTIAASEAFVKIDAGPSPKNDQNTKPEIANDG